jgi:hypothetical protein
MIGSCHATPGFCDACGMSSMSEPSAMTGLPLPHVAVHASECRPPLPES